MADSEDKKKDIYGELEALGGLAEGLSGFDDLLSDPFGEEGMSLPDGGGMPQGIPGIGPGGFAVPGMPKDIALYDTVIVHGLRGDYRLTFEETEDGLVINVADRGET